jgi:hypothetical protein
VEFTGVLVRSGMESDVVGEVAKGATEDAHRIP